MKNIFVNFLALAMVLIIITSCENQDADNTKTDYYGWAVGSNRDYGFVLHTKDGGKTWNTISDSTQLKSYFLDLCIFDKNTLLIVGGPTPDGSPNVIKSIDGGYNWTATGVGTLPNTTYNGIFKLNDQNVYIVGDSGNIYKSSDMAVNWTKIEVPPMYQECNFLRVAAKNANDIWVVGENFEQDSTPIMLHTTDGGLNWIRPDIIKELNFKQAYGGHYLGIKILGNSVWVIGGFGKFVFRSNDNGNTWTDVTPNATLGDANDIFLISETEVVVVTDYGGVFYSGNGGVDWTQRDISTNDWLLGIDIIDGNKLWLCGSPGSGNEHTVIFYSSNKGSTWQEQSPEMFMNNPFLSLYKIRFLKVETRL
ncbi:MAG: YCF48-related protein [bacterium]